MRASLIACLLLGGCAHTEIQRVDVPVPVPCHVQLPSAPTSTFDALPEDAGLYDSVKALIVDREAQAAYDAQMRAALQACE